MQSLDAICENVFVGHMLGSKLDPTIELAMNIDGSLAEKKKFDATDIFLRYVKLGSPQNSINDQNLKSLYSAFLSKYGLSFDQTNLVESNIFELVKNLQNDQGTLRASSVPAQRSYPLALCPYIKTEDLFELSLRESRLTHCNPIEGQVAGLVNLIIRYQMQNDSWHEAIQNAFCTHGIHCDLLSFPGQYVRSPISKNPCQSSSTPDAFLAALYAVSRHNSSEAAITEGLATGKPLCAALTGILAASRWGIQFSQIENFPQRERIHINRQKMTSWSQFWIKNEQPTA